MNLQFEAVRTGFSHFHRGKKERKFLRMLESRMNMFISNGCEIYRHLVWTVNTNFHRYDLNVGHLREVHKVAAWIFCTVRVQFFYSILLNGMLQFILLSFFIVFIAMSMLMVIVMVMVVSSCNCCVCVLLYSVHILRKKPETNASKWCVIYIQQ